MKKNLFLVFGGILIIAVSAISAVGLLNNSNNQTAENNEQFQQNTSSSSASSPQPMNIEALRSRQYPGSEIVIEETLESGSNFSRYIASYQSEGNKIYGLLTIPNTEKPNNGFPLIVFLHGYIPPDQYRTTERYVEYQAGLASSGFITYKIDLRGHGNSEGEPVTGHFSEAYVVDTLNAVSALQKHPDTNPEKVGIWGHSNGGQIGLRSMVVSSEIDAGVFWAGVVGSFEGMLETYNDDIHFLNLENRGTPSLVQENGLPSQNPEFWNQIDPYNYLEEISGPVQLHHGTADDSVPIELSLQLRDALEAADQTVELYEYSGGDHNLASPDFTPAMQRSIEFFEQYLKN